MLAMGLTIFMLAGARVDARGQESPAQAANYKAPAERPIRCETIELFYCGLPCLFQ